MLSRLLINPYILYGVTWFVVVTLYGLHWTDLYPRLSSDLTWFVIITCILSFVWGWLKFKSNAYVLHQHIPTYKIYRIIRKWSTCAAGFMCVEFIAFRTIPIVSYLRGTADASLYQEFGLPFVHVIAVNLFEFAEFFIFYNMILSTNRRLRKKFRNLFLFNLAMLVTIMNRAVIMYIIFGCILIFCVVKKNIGKYLGYISVLILGLFYLFGLMGNIRNAGSNEAGKQYILNLGEASTEFYESGVPAEYFWPYIYITSPISNVQYTIQKTHPKVTLDNAISFAINDCLPQTISKRLDVDNKEGKLVLESLNVGSVYMNCYASLGWLGMWLIFAFMFLFIEINTKIVSNKSVCYVPFIILIDVIILFNIFDNMFIFAGLVPAVLITICFSRIKWS